MAAKKSSEHSRIVPFVRPTINVSEPLPAEKGNILTLPDLVEFSASYNPNYTFCLQYGHNIREAPRVITHGDLYQAVLRCSAWLLLYGLAQRPQVVDGKVAKARPVAMLMSSDITWLITFVSLLRLGVPVLCMSARLSSQAVVHLIQKTDAQAVLVSPQLDSLVDESKSLLQTADSATAIPNFYEVPSYTEFLNPASQLDISSVPPPPRHIDFKDRNVLILHSSGTTGLPKPIYHSHAYVLGYAACHRLSLDEVENSMNVSTLPLYHGFGLLAPCLSLSIGLPVAMPGSTTIPTGNSTYEILQSSGATSLMTVPSILEELYLLENNKGVDLLKSLRFVAVGGAPMKISVAEPLVAAGVPLLNHWGVTEIGAIAPIMIPRADYDWHYLRVREDIHLRFEPVEGDEAGHYRLIGRPPFIDDDFEVQDFLVANPNNPTKEFRIAGRADDLVVLATGEKVRPTLLEQHVSEHPLVRGAVAFGDGKFQLGLIVEAHPNVELDVSDPAAVSAYIDNIWPSVTAGNEVTDHHARVTREMIIITTPAVQSLIRTPKGSIPRRPNVEIFQAQVDEVYARADMVDAEPLPLEDTSKLKDAVRNAVVASFTIPRSISDTDDFFERGMDSLQATMLRRRLAAGLALSAEQSGKDVNPLPVDIVYANPSVELLFKALAAHCGEGGQTQDRILHIREVAAEYVKKVSELQPTTASGLPSSADGAVVLLTGSTGNLGSAMLHELVSASTVSKVYALNRGGSRPLRDRQEQGLQKIGVQLEDLWSKVELLEADLSAEHLGFDDATYNSLRQVTHIIHNAWPMDFNRALTSFRPHLEASKNVIQLALDSTSSQPVKVLFSSSIAVVGRYHLVGGPSVAIPEAPLEQPEAVDHFGYAEAKWVCEKMFQKAGELYGTKMVVNSVRIGQMTGAEATGAWNVAEHFPMIVKSCHTIGGLPIVDGSASWIPVNRAAKVMTELLFGISDSGVLHLENPSRQPWRKILRVLAPTLGLSTEHSPLYHYWLDKVKGKPDAVTNPCVKIVPFLENEFIRMATGQVVLDTSLARKISPTLYSSNPLSDEHLVRYVEYWKQEKFLV